MGIAPSKVFFLLLMLAAHPCLADSSNNDSDNGTTSTNYYWQGNQINNLSRLTQGSPDFEEIQRRARLGGDADQYLSSIRAQIAHQAAADAKTKELLTFQGQLPGNPLEMSNTPDGIQVTLHAEMLFDENSSAVKIGAVDILDRLRDLLQNQSRQPVHLLISDRLDEGPEASNVDAARSLMIAALLEFPESGARQENLNPEQLTTQ